MKKGLLITSAFALLFGVGVAVGAQQQRTERASADTVTTLYLDTNNLDWYGNMSRAYLYGTGGDNTWPGQPLTLVSGSIYKLDVTNISNYQSVIFLRSDGTNVWNRTSADGKTAITLPADWTTQNMWKFSGWDGNEKNDGNDTGSWMLYTPTEYTVSVHLDNKGVKTTTNQTVAKDGLPTVDYVYGESFSGWFDDENYTKGHEVTAITSNTTVYGKITALASHTYTLDKSAVASTFTAPQLWSWVAGKNNAESWPGVAIENNTFTLYEGAQFIISSKAEADGRKQTVDLSQPANPVANEKLVLNADPITEEGDDKGKYTAYWELDEVPANDGYYVVGSKNDYKFRGATLVPSQEADVDGNIAILSGYTAAVGEEITIRSYASGVNGWIANNDPVKDSVDPAQYAYGYRDGSNFHFLTAGSYDIFVHADSFYVATHAERHNVAITNVFFNGKTKTDTSDRPATIATEGGNFNPGEYDVLGYAQRGYYTNEACTTAYTPAEVTIDDLHLYCKYTKQGFYVTGDTSFSGSADNAWKVDGATYLTDDVNDTVNNLFEGTIVIPAGASEEHPVQVRPAQYVGPGADGWNWNIEYSISDYDFAKKVGDNIEITESGTFAIYVSKSYVVYINKGLAAFNTKFITDIGGVCDDQGNTNLVTLKAMWAEEKIAFNSLSAAEKLEYTSKTIDSGNEKGSDLEKVIAKYSYIVHKYGTTNFEDFIWGGTYAGTSEVLATYQAPENNGTLAVLIIITTFAAIGVGVLVLTKKKHE